MGKSWGDAFAKRILWIEWATTSEMGRSDVVSFIWWQGSRSDSSQQSSSTVIGFCAYLTWPFPEHGRWYLQPCSRSYSHFDTFDCLIVRMFGVQLQPSRNDNLTTGCAPLSPVAQVEAKLFPISGVESLLPVLHPWNTVLILGKAGLYKNTS